MQGTRHRPLRGYVDIFPANAPSLAVLGDYSKRVPRPFDSETEDGHEQEIPDVLTDGTACNVYEHPQILAMILCDSYRVPRDPRTSECMDALQERDNEERETRKQDRCAWGLIIDKRSERTTSEDTHR